MAFDVVMYGSIAVPERNVEEWLTTPVETTDFPWLDEVGGVDVVQDSPEALLALLADQALAPHELFDVSLADGRLSVACYVSEDRFRETSQALALLVASAAGFGGVGEVFFCGYQGIRFGERITVRAGRATYTCLPAEELSWLERLPAFQSLDARIHERYDALVGRRAGPVDPRRSRWVVHPFTGRKVRVAADAAPDGPC
jgi:hypothetical protein